MTHTCPLCHSQAEIPEVAIVLGANLIVVKDTVVKVRPKEAELAFVMWNNYPNYVDSSFIISSLYGDKENWPIDPQAPRRYIKKLRASLQGTILDIETRHTRGWRFKIKEHTTGTT